MASPRASPSAFQTLPFLIDVKLDRTSAPLSERSVVMVISPLVSLRSVGVSVRRSVPFSLEGSIVVTFAENWSQSKYVVSAVWPECPRDLCVSETCVYPIRGTGLVA